MDRMSFPNNPFHPVNPVLIKLDFIPPFAVFAIFCKKFFGSRSRRPDDRGGQRIAVAPGAGQFRLPS